MHLVAPLSSLEDLDYLLEAGVDEFYAGLFFKEYPETYMMNRRPVYHANLNSFEELKQAIEKIHSCKKKFLLALNSFYYTPDQYVFLHDIISKACEYRVDAVIVSDLALILYIKKFFPDLPMHLSTTASIFNSEALKFHEKFNFKRIILPRHLTVEEIIYLKNLCTCEIEIFIYGQRCSNDDGLCTWDHCLIQFGKKNDAPAGVVGCHLKTNYEIVAGSKNEEERNLIYERFYHPEHYHYCGLCYLFDFYKAGIKYYKIPGRDERTSPDCIERKDIDSTKRKFEAVKLVKKTIKLLIDNSENRDSFIHETRKNFSELIGRECAPDFCYYCKENS